ncbi:MAG: carboxypeptidase-like regulatory domain-containing protein [Fuerstiella sp.]
MLAPVSGNVTLDGNPLPGVTLTFTPVGSGRPSVAVTDIDGNYTLEYLTDAKGAMIGKHKVVVSVIDYGDEFENVEGSAKPPSVTLPKNALDGSIEREVSEGANTIDFELQL